MKVSIEELNKLALIERLKRPSMPGLPKYAQLRAALLELIESGHWKPGAQLPTEAELTAATPFSLGTVQRALRALVEEGIVVRRQGHGTFVAEGRKRMDAPLHFRFLNDDGSAFLPVFPKVVLRKRVDTRGPWSSYLGQKGNNIIRIDRKISVNGEFYIYSKFYLNADRFGVMLRKPVSELDGANFKDILYRESGVAVARIFQTLGVAKFPDRICRAIKVALGTVGMVVEVVASEDSGACVYYQELFIPPAKRKLYVSGIYQEPKR